MGTYPNDPKNKEESEKMDIVDEKLEINSAGQTEKETIQVKSPVDIIVEDATFSAAKFREG